MTLLPQPAAWRTRIKICGITRECDVDMAVAAGVDALGFVLYAPSARAVSVQRAAELARRLPPFVMPVLLFVNADISLVQAAIQALPHALLQFHGDETPSQCLKAAGAGGGYRPFMRVARIPIDDDAASEFDLVEYAHQYSQAQALLLDAHVDGYGGAGQTFNWSFLSKSVNAHLVLSGGLTPANVTDGILRIRPKCLSLAVDVSSGVEATAADGSARKGIKDAEKIQRFVAAVRAADAQPLSIS